MRNIWIISDHHYGQESILTFRKHDGNLLRPGFDDVDNMNDYMLECHNEVVKDGDTVWLLGDLYHKTFQDFFKSKYAKQMKGRLNITPGNHDNIKELVFSKRFRRVNVIQRMDDLGVILSHYPLDVGSCYSYRTGKYLLNIHGHTHYHEPPTNIHFNASVERLNYTPMNLDEIRGQYEMESTTGESIIRNPEVVSR